MHDPIRTDQSKTIIDGRLCYSADGSEVFPGASGVRKLPAPTRFAQEIPADVTMLTRAQCATVASLQLVAPELSVFRTIAARGLTPVPESVLTVGRPEPTTDPFAPPRAFLHPDGSLRTFYAPAQGSTS